MGKDWRIPPISVWRELYRVLKPGGHVLSFGGTRTFDLIALGLRAAGFQFRDTIGAEGVLRWVQSQGMPKGIDVAKAIDAMVGVAPTVIGTRVLTGSAAMSTAEKGGTYAAATRSAGRKKEVAVTAPTSPEAQAWDGWNVALKPTWEPILIFRKPLDGTVAENVLRHGTGGLNVDGCRVRVDPDADADQLRPVSRGQRTDDDGWGMNATGSTTGQVVSPEGRWPPNQLLCHLPSCLPTKTIDVWDCAPGCPVAALDAQSGECPAGIAVLRNGGGGKIFGSENTRGPSPDGGYTDTGTASRFFPQFGWDPVLDGPGFLYVAKASGAERDAGLDGEINTHVSVKPVTLMQWLIRLVTPPGGLVLDPYSGSGTTGVAAMREAGGFRFLGIDVDPDYVPIAIARIRHVSGGHYRTLAEIAAAAAAGSAGPQKQLGLF